MGISRQRGQTDTSDFSAYQPGDPTWPTPRGKTVWDQHIWYFEAQGEVQNPQSMFKLDLLSILWGWKAAGDEILLIRDLNKNVYMGQLATSLTDDGLRMSKICRRTTGISLPPTHHRGSVPINAIFAMAGLVCLAVALLPDGMGVSYHRVFVEDIESDSIIGNVFPHILPAASQLLNCISDRIKSNYTRVLNQLSNRHHIFTKLLVISGDCDYIPTGQVQVQMNKVDQELEEFMKSSKKGCHKYREDHIKWTPLAGVWIHQRWLLIRVQAYPTGKTRDPRKLFTACRKRGVKDPHLITEDEL